MTDNEKREVEFQRQLTEKAKQKVREAHLRLENGRNYLESMNQEPLTIEEVLKAFGFGKKEPECE